jgi:hypothetical protein
MRALLFIALASCGGEAGDGSRPPGNEIAILLELKDPNEACESTFDELGSARLEIAGDAPMRSPCVSIAPVADAVSLESALSGAGLELDRLDEGEALVSLHGFQDPGCLPENLVLCAEASVRLEPDVVRSVELTLYCETLEDLLEERFRDCVE